MEQKYYKYPNEKLEILGELVRGDSHVRGLAKKLGINHMSVSRKLKELSGDNVADYRKEGKNNVYFLKRTPEAKAYILMYEQYKLVKLLERYPRLRKIIEKIQENNRIKMALIFGSYAKRAAKKDSDVDVYIETTDRALKRQLELLDSRLNVKIGSYERGNPLIGEIEKNHVVIKGTEEYYEKNKIFG